MKGAIGMERFSLKRLTVEGLWGRLFTGDPGRYVKKGSGYGQISPERHHWGTWREFTCWDF